MKNFLLSSEIGGITLIVLFMLLTVVTFGGFIWLTCVSLGSDSAKLKLKLKPMHIFLIVLVIGAAIRMAIAFSVRGLVGTISADSAHRMGYTGVVRMVNALITGGFKTFSESYRYVGYYPITMYFLSFFGSINSLFGSVSIDSEATLILLKLPFIISDMLLAFTIYKIAAKYTSELTALGFGGLVALCPVFMLGSVWPSVYTFLALILAVCMYLMLEKRYILLTIAYTLALLIGFEAVYVLPIIAVSIGYAYVKKLMARKANGGDIMSKENRFIVLLPVTIVACIVASYLILLPFALNTVGANPFAMLYEYYLKPFDNFGYFTFNGLSLYTIFGRNGAELLLSFPQYVFSLLFIVAIFAVTLIIYLTKKNRANLVMLASYVLLLLNVYFVDSFELTLLPFMAVSLIAFLINKDRRLLRVMAIVAFFTVFNAVFTLLKADYISANASFVDEELDGGYAAVSIISSVMAVIAHVYYTLILLDIVMNSRIKKLSSDGNSFGAAMKGFIRIKD